MLHVRKMLIQVEGYAAAGRGSEREVESMDPRPCKVIRHRGANGYPWT